MQIFHDSMRRVNNDNPMPWLKIDKAKMAGYFEMVPEREQILEPINEQFVRLRFAQSTDVDVLHGGRVYVRHSKSTSGATFSSAQDSNSVYYATAYSPVYHLDSANAGAATLKIMPEPGSDQKGRILSLIHI